METIAPDIYPVKALSFSRRPKKWADRKFRRKKRPKKKRDSHAGPQGQAPEVAPNALNPSRIHPGSTEFLDTTASSTYNWLLCPPKDAATSKGHWDAPFVAPIAHKKVPLLSRLCADAVAENSSLLHPTYLDNWRTWKVVWELILRKQLDSPYVFAMFAQKFQKEPAFRCHNRHTIQDGLVLSKFNHRIETFGPNISFKELSAFVHENDFNLLLDLSLKCETVESNIMFQMANLCALDLSSMPDVDDAFLARLASTMGDNPQKFCHLKVLVLTNCRNVTADGILKFMKVPHLILFVESDHMVVDLIFAANHTTNPHRYATNTNYRYLEEECKIVSKLPLGMKVYALRDRYPLSIDSKDGRVCLDVVISPFNVRNSRSFSSRVTHCYVLDPPRDSKIHNHQSTSASRPIMESPSIFKVNSRKILLAEHDKPNTKRSKPLLKKVNVNKFFDIT